MLVAHDCYVDMTFRDPRAQLTLHNLCGWTSVDIFSFLSYTRAAGLLVQIPNPRNRKAALRFVLPLLSIACGLFIFFMLMLLVRILNLRNRKAVFSVHTASSSTCSLFLRAHLSMNFKHKPNDLCRATNRDDILTAAGTQPLFKSQSNSTPNFSFEYDTVSETSEGLLRHFKRIQKLQLHASPSLPLQRSLPNTAPV